MGLIDLKTDLKSLKYGSMPLGSDAPYITEDINNPPSSNRFSMQITKRVDDLSRITQMLADKPGLRYLANEALLQQIGIGSRIDKARKGGKSIAGAVLQQIGRTAIGTVKIIGSTLAQVPVAGTGTHFLKGFRTDTYLQPAEGNPASPFAQFFGAGGVEGAPYALRGAEVPGTAKSEIENSTSKFQYDAKLDPKDKELWETKENRPLTEQNAFRYELNSKKAKGGKVIGIETSEPATGINADTGEVTQIEGLSRAPRSVGVETTATKGLHTSQNLIQSIPHTGAIAGDVVPDSSNNLPSSSYSYENPFSGKPAKDSINSAQTGAPISVAPIETTAKIEGSKPTDTTGSDLLGLVNNFDKAQYSDNASYAEISTNDATVYADGGKDIVIKSTGSFVSGESVVKNTKYGYNGSAEVPIGENEAKNKPQDEEKLKTAKSNAQTGAPVDVGGRQTTVTKGELPGTKPTGTSGGFSQVSANKTIRDFRSGSAYVKSSGIRYASQNMESRIHIGRQGKDRSGDRYQSVDPETVDKLSKLPIGTERQDASKEARDLAKLFFEIITPDDSSRGHGNFIHFRAYIESIDDSYTADWQTHKYVGRAENFQTYGGFDRDISVSFKIAAMTRSELKPLYQKMVYLASTTAPTYSNTFMRGTVVKMTIGSYINQQPGVITSVKYSLIGDMPWEIAMQGPSGGESDVQELPMGLQCTVSFRPIHNFAPQTGLFPYITSVDSQAKFFTETQHKDIR